MNKKNVKGFVKEHKKEIQFATAMVLVGTVGFMLGKQRAGTYIGDEILEKILLDAEEQYQGKYVIFGGKSSKSIKPELLGELGKEILKNEGAENDTFQHFIAIGPYET